MRYPLTSLLHPPSRVPRVLSTAAASGAASATVAPVQWTPALPAPQAAYLHIPFCRRRCFYCDFPIQVVGDRQRTADTASEAYVELLLREILASPEGHAGRPLRSVYFGGGTPSLLPPHLLAKVMRTLRERYGFAGELECTLEMDPGTFDEARLGAFLEAGVTRVSLGTQSFDDALLKACGRAHGLADTERALSLLGAARERGALRELSVDLIGGLPEQASCRPPMQPELPTTRCGLSRAPAAPVTPPPPAAPPDPLAQTLEQWRHSLAAAAASPATHVSVYDLQARLFVARPWGSGQSSRPLRTLPKPCRWRTAPPSVGGRRRGRCRYRRMRWPRRRYT